MISFIAIRRWGKKCNEKKKKKGEKKEIILLKKKKENETKKTEKIHGTKIRRGLTAIFFFLFPHRIRCIICFHNEE